MNIKLLLHTLNSNPEQVTFDDVISVIDSDFTFTPSNFTNGDITNEAGENSGSCKIFAFAKRYNLSQQQTLHCFGDYYRQDVLKNPSLNNHQNIRNFMRTGWDGVIFNNKPLEDM